MNMHYASGVVVECDRRPLQGIQALRLIIAIGLFASLWHSETLLAEPPSLSQRQNRWDTELKRLTFAAPGDCGLQSSLTQFNADCDVRIVLKPRKHDGSLMFEFVRDGKVILSLEGHFQPAFVSHNNTLYFAEYPLLSSGCTVSAYDLGSGKKLWSTKLHGEEPGGHSVYVNRVMIKLSNQNEVKDDPGGDAIVVNGQESYCDYIEALDAKSGTSLATRLYRVGYIDPATEAPPAGSKQ